MRKKVRQILLIKFSTFLAPFVPPRMGQWNKSLEFREMADQHAAKAAKNHNHARALQRDIDKLEKKMIRKSI